MSGVQTVNYPSNSVKLRHAVYNAIMTSGLNARDKRKTMIKIEHPDEPLLDSMKVKSWPIWEKEVSVFPWQYDSTETCYILEGEVTVTPDDGDPVSIKPGDLVTFEKGLSCTWDIKTPIRKHYNFS
jgi:uncharacterized cupin superfamily protein